uniref:ODF3A protein n=1 Tax=Malurus cyaneus samueli TaxID=2593467 RepID=A0A8C5TLC3_9PASS
MEGPWVGSWRPHPRRGPILAEFATPGPKYWLPGSVGDYTTQTANRIVYYSAPVHTSHCSLSCRTHLHSLPLPSPGPATYTLPRILGPNTAYTHANPCYSMKWKSQYGSCFRDLAKTPGPAAFDRVEMDVYKTRAPKFTMGLRTKLAGPGASPGPAEYVPGKVRQPSQQRALPHGLHSGQVWRTRHQFTLSSSHFPLPVVGDQGSGPCFHFWNPTFSLQSCFDT